ncbi:MAG: response regulator [bacterium]|nr:response regulator [bacterium]
MRKKILVVDDECFMREALVKVLSLDDYNILMAENGFKAIEILRKDDVSLVVTDILMPDCDGFSLCNWIREWKPEVKVIFITAYVGENFNAKIESLKPDGYIYKPFTIDRFLTICKNSLNS